MGKKREIRTTHGVISPPTAREGNVFRSVCLSTEGVCLLGGMPPKGGGGDLLQMGVCFQGVASGRGTSAQPPGTDIWWQPLQQLVRILLECILFLDLFLQDRAPPVISNCILWMDYL